MEPARQAKPALGLRAQARLAWRLGLIACLAGFGCAVAAVVLEKGPAGPLAVLMAAGSMGLIACGTLAGFGLGFFRPMMAHGWHGVPQGALRDFILRFAVLRWWYWVDEKGRSRDDGE